VHRKTTLLAKIDLNDLQNNAISWRISSAMNGFFLINLLLAEYKVRKKDGMAYKNEAIN
jgi:hypothetical protein